MNNQKTNNLMPILGIDLAGSPRRATGLCLLHQNMKCRTWIAYRDDDILQAVEEHKPNLVAVDAPLSLPKGRKSLDERSNIHFRVCDLELRRRGIKFFPITLGPMRMLTARGMRIKEEIKKRGAEVIEVFPGATQDILGLPRKHHNLKQLIQKLRRLGLRCLSNKATGDEVDAATCALTGLLYLRGFTEAVGDLSEGVIIIPRRGIIDTCWRRRSLG